MNLRKLGYYYKLKRIFIPINLNLIFLLESPPSSGKYFYDTTGEITEPLFSAFMQVFNINASNKEEGLKEFCKRGYLLVDATYTPVDKMKSRERKQTILNDYINLVMDLRNLIKNKDVKIILIKTNIYRLLKDKLLKDGFSIFNGDTMIPFPSNGWQKMFQERLRIVLKPAH
jgi:hypothetical protein